ncbi:MAG: hypothetical protein RL367_2813, partial [Pseudomonadota bacterium]
MKAKRGVEQGLDRWLRRAVLVGALLVGCLVAVEGSSSTIEEGFRNIRDGLRQTSASGQIVVAEMDATSLQRFNAWPWPRRYHAALLDRLGAAGVSSVAFDIDFSSPSSPAQDAILAAALARFDGMVILPTFQQASATASNRQIENLPIKPFQEHAFLGSVNVMPDADGVMRNYSYGVTTNNIPRPSIGAIMASKPGEVGTDFRIDAAIDPATIPRVSYADIVEGKVPAATLRGKTVLVGATAIELGDRYPVLRHGVIPGVFIQAMGAETLLKGSMNPSLGSWPAMVIMLLVGLTAMRAKQPRWRAAILVLAALGVLVLDFGLESACLGSLELAPALIAGLVFAAGSLAVSIALRLRHSRMVGHLTGLPNERSLELAIAPDRDSGVMAVHFRHFGQTLSVLDAHDRSQLVLRMIERLQLGCEGTEIHALQPGQFGWKTGAGPIEEQIELADTLATLFISPIELGTRSILVTPAFGLVKSQSGNLISAATLSAARAAESGQRWMVHSAETASATDRAIRLLADLETALTENQIWVAYQPKWSISAKSTLGAEALVRWRHPVFGPISPDEFIPLLEHEGRLERLTMHVVDQCLIDLRDWRASGHPVGIAINISAPLLNNDQFVADLTAKAGDNGFPAGTLTFEVTESAAIIDSEVVVKALETLRETGARVSIDDYGTGQSTLTYLKSFPADEIKIDKSFVSRMVDSTGDQVLVRSTIAMAHDLGFKVVAEGVEDAACLAKLGEFG